MTRLKASTVLLCFAVSGCGGSTPAVAPSPVTIVPTAAPTAPPAPASTPTAAGATCPYGKGSLGAQCGRIASTYVADVDRAIADLAKRRPDIFNLADEQTPGNYRVVKIDEYFGGLVQQLVLAGFCAQTDGVQTVQIKKSADLSEKYAVLTSDGYIRKGPGAYRDSCQPAIFPVEDVDYIDAVRVHFFSVRCFDDRVAPDNAEKLLPLGCRGYVSATPKQKDNTDVPPEIHGPDILWETFQGDGENVVRVSEFPGQPFNKIVDPLNVGYFTMCATVKGVRGCFGFDVIP
jgi:hypothetical protein